MLQRDTVKDREQKHLSENSVSSARPEFLYLSEPGSSALCSAFLSYIRHSTLVIPDWQLGTPDGSSLPARVERGDDKRDLVIRSHPSTCSYRCRQACCASNLITAILASVAEESPATGEANDGKDSPYRDHD